MNLGLPYIPTLSKAEPLHIFGRSHLVQVKNENQKEIMTKIIEKYLQSIGEIEFELSEITQNVGKTQF